MSYQFFSRNGILLPADQAIVPLDDIAFSYGYGVYETIRLHQGIPYFQSQHWQRLLNSAATIGLEHTITIAFLEQSLSELVVANKAEEANIKVLLIGGVTASNATLYMQLLNPLYPNRQLYRDGVHVITQEMERAYPQAKTLNMLPSYLAYKEALAAEAYDALLINSHDAITEGTRTNFFVMRGDTIIGAPNDQILPGVMRQAVLQVAKQTGFELAEEPIPIASLADYDAAFLTSTSIKIMPIASIDDHVFPAVSPELKRLMQLFSEYYDNCGGVIDATRSALA